MTNKKINQTPLSLLQFSVGMLFNNPLIFYPFLVSAFIQIFILEILYFSARYPLSIFFAPIIKTLYGEIFLHFPFHTYLIPKLFQAVQIPIYIFITTFLIGTAIIIIAAINNDKKISFVMAMKEVWKHYVYLVVSAGLMFFILQSCFNLYEILIKRALEIRSSTGIFYLIKIIIIYSSPYIHVGIGILVSTLFGFIFQIILISKRKIFSALYLNFKYLINSFCIVFLLVLIPTIVYLPILLLRNYLAALPDGGVIGFRLISMMISIVIMVIIDAVVYTSLTTLYLFKYENK